MILDWMQQGIQSNIIASAIVGVIAYFWKIRPHMKKTEAHHRIVLSQLNKLKEK